MPGAREVSTPINIFNPGCKDKFLLKSETKIFEYSY